MRKICSLHATTVLACATTLATAGDILFTDVTEQVGVDFVMETPPKWILNNSHFYGGVGVADFDGNGALDLFFSGVGYRKDTLYPVSYTHLTLPTILLV